MFETSRDILNLSLAVGFGLIALFLSLALYQLIFVLRDLSEVTRALRNTARNLDAFVVAPAKLITFFIERVKSAFGMFDDVVKRKKK